MGVAWQTMQEAVSGIVLWMVTRTAAVLGAIADMDVGVVVVVAHEPVRIH